MWYNPAVIQIAGINHSAAAYYLSYFLILVSLYYILFFITEIVKVKYIAHFGIFKTNFKRFKRCPLPGNIHAGIVGVPPLTAVIIFTHIFKPYGKFYKFTVFLHFENLLCHTAFFVSDKTKNFRYFFTVAPGYIINIKAYAVILGVACRIKPNRYSAFPNRCFVASMRYYLSVNWITGVYHSAAAYGCIYFLALVIFY